MQWFAEMAVTASVMVGLLVAGVSSVVAADLKEYLLISREAGEVLVSSRQRPWRLVAQGGVTPNVEAPGAEAPGGASSGVETPGAEAPGAEMPGADVPNVDVPNVDVPNVDALPEAERYEATGRRDPFESLVKEETPTIQKPLRDPSRPRGPLERFDLSALQLTGIVWGDLGRRAVIRAPDGKGYFVTVGMYMGQNEGQVIEIENHRVVILEKYQDAKGRRLDKTLTIPLRREE